MPSEPCVLVDIPDKYVYWASDHDLRGTVPSKLAMNMNHMFSACAIKARKPTKFVVHPENVKIVLEMIKSSKLNMEVCANLSVEKNKIILAYEELVTGPAN